MRGRRPPTVQRVCHAAIVDPLDRILPRIGVGPVDEHDRVDVSHGDDEAVRVLKVTDDDLHAGQRLAGAGLVAGQRDGSQPARGCSGYGVPTGAAGRARDQNPFDGGGHRLLTAACPA
jgi:hypothetical protein